jgi:hypothetical protein
MGGFPNSARGASVYKWFVRGVIEFVQGWAGGVQGTRGDGRIMRSRRSRVLKRGKR